MTKCNVVLLTAVGRGAVSTIRIEGQEAAAHIDRHWHSASGVNSWQMPPERIFLGRWHASEGAGEEVVLCRRAPDVFEVHCHGGQAAAGAILRSLAIGGCRQLDWKSWLHCRCADAVRAEARIAVAEATTERTASILLQQYGGSLRAAIQQIVAQLHETGSRSAIAPLDRLIRRSDFGLHLTRPWQVALAGPANVGKSSLMNALLGYRRAIVSETPGTTRDIVTATTAVDGWPLELVDMAGLRTTNDAIESEGVLRARRLLRGADLVVLVFDLSQPWRDAEAELAVSFPDALLVHNKSDLKHAPSPPRPPGLRISARTGRGVKRLLDRVAKQLVRETPQPHEPIPFTQRQIDLLEAAREAASDGKVAIAIAHLEQI